MVVDARQHRRHRGHGRAPRACASRRASWPGWVDQKNFAASLASHDWIFSLDADERAHAGAGARDQAASSTGPATMAPTGCRASPSTSGDGSAPPTSIPTSRPGSTTAASRAGRAGYVHESVTADGPVGTLTQELQHYSYRDLRRSPGPHQPLHDARGAADVRARAPRLARRSGGPGPRRRSCATTSCGAAFSTARSGFTLSVVNAYSVFLKFAKLWELQRTCRSGAQRDS